jgi:hypothetical protein
MLSGGDWTGPPFAVMLQAPTFTHTEAGQEGGAAPHFGTNNNFALQQVSLFTGGRITDNLGAFVVQVGWAALKREALMEPLCFKILGRRPAPAIPQPQSAVSVSIRRPLWSSSSNFTIAESLTFFAVQTRLFYLRRAISVKRMCRASSMTTPRKLKND